MGTTATETHGHRHQAEPPSGAEPPTTGGATAPTVVSDADGETELCAEPAG